MDRFNAGPGALLAPKRVGYHTTDIKSSRLFETLTFNGS
jgi:hypothetical protein